MGCTSSQIQSHSSYLNRKPELWFILGGPGSNKGKLIEYLVRDYKYMYLSVFEILQFQKQRNTPDAELIKKSILDKKDFSSELITRLLKKAIASLGPRRYLIDGYPRNQADVQEFQKQTFLKQVNLQKLIHIQVSEKKMKKTGLEAKKGDKRPQEQVEKEVQQVIDEYRKHEQKIIQLYKAKNSIISIPQRDTEDETYNELRLEFQTLPKFRSINEGDARVFFASFDLETDQIKFTHQMVKAYGFYHFDYAQLINQCKQKNNKESKYLEECQQKKQQPSSEFVIHLFKKQIERKDYVVNFLIIGFPRNITDAELWDKTFGWQLVVDTYLDFCVSDDKVKKNIEKTPQEKSDSKPQNAISNFQKYTKNKKVLSDFYQKHQKYLKINFQSSNKQQILKLIDNLMSQKAINKRLSSFTHKLIFMSTINDNFTLSQQKQATIQQIKHESNIKPVPNNKESIKMDHLKEINMMYCYENQAKQNGLYSELIQSYVKSGAPLPGFLAVKILMKNLNFLISSEASKHNQELSILVKSFPNSVDQMKSWEEQIGDTYPIHSVIYFDTNEEKIKQVLTKHKSQFTHEMIEKIKRNSLQLEEFLKPYQTQAHKMANQQKTQEFIQSLV